MQETVEHRLHFEHARNKIGNDQARKSQIMQGIQTNDSSNQILQEVLSNSGCNSNLECETELFD